MFASCRQSRQRTDHGMEITGILFQLLPPFINGIKLPLPTHLRTMNSNLIFSRKKLFFCLLLLLKFADSNHSIGPETVTFFDGSSLIGSLQGIESKGNLVWRHKSSQDPLRFKYNAVDSVLFNRVLPVEKLKPVGQLLIKFNNNDFLRGTITSLNSENLFFPLDLNKLCELNYPILPPLSFYLHHIEFCMIHHTISENGKRAIRRLGRKKKVV